MKISEIVTLEHFRDENRNLTFGPCLGSMSCEKGVATEDD